MEQNPASMVLDEVDPKTVYIGTFGRKPDGSPGPCNLLAVRMDQGQMTKVRVLNQMPMVEDFISSMVVMNEHIIWLGRRHLGVIPKAGGEARELMEIPDWMDPRGMTTDGRFLYVAITATEIVRIDIATPSRMILLTRITQFATEEIQNLALDNHGELLVVTADLAHGARLLGVDHQTGLVFRSLRLPMLGARAVGQDPQTGQIHIVGGTAAGVTAAVTVDDWKVSKGPFGQLPNAAPTLLVARPRSFFRTGVACVGNNGEVARIGMVGRASTKGPGFGITLQGQPRRSAILAIGLENPNPFIHLVNQGAPGCFLLAHTVVLRTAVTDGAGVGFSRFSPPKKIDGKGLLYQWIMQSTGANSLGAITSDVARVIVRE